MRKGIERQAGKPWIPCFLRLLVWLAEGIELITTDYKADAQTTILYAMVCDFNW